MSTSPTLQGRSRWAARAGVFVVTVFAAISASTAVVGLDPVVDQPAPAPAPTTSTTPTTRTEPVADPLPDSAAPDPFEQDPCGAFLADFCVEVETVSPAQTQAIDACTTGLAHAPGGMLRVIDSPLEAVNETAIRLRVEVEDGLAVDGSCFATKALQILGDERGWSSVENVSFVQVDDESYDFRLVLASPDLTDDLCWPARTGGLYSCRKQNTVVINLNRWENGTEEYSGRLSTYRTYLINHEVGHFLGHGHLSCPGPGELAPVMMQQTKGLNGCLPNGWPTKDEH